MRTWRGSTAELEEREAASRGAGRATCPRNGARPFRNCRRPRRANCRTWVFSRAILDCDRATATDVTSSGTDQVEFQFAPNAGEPARPLRAIASSGEMSRVMLALKTVLAAEDEIPLLVFDEIDANVGGETAAVVGQKMAQIAERHQVICITHLPAVAVGAAWHFVVTKREEGGRTISEMTRLDQPARVQEVARMLGGQSEVARLHAEELLEVSQSPRRKLTRPGGDRQSAGARNPRSSPEERISPVLVPKQIPIEERKPMRKPMEYVIVTGNTLGELEKKVNEGIAQGFEPTGGVFAGLAASVGLTRWLQAMVKVEDRN